MKHHLLKSLLAIALGISSTAFAADTYTSDPSHTFVSFEYSHMGYSKQRSRFDKVNATVTLDPAAKTGSVDVTIDTKSVNTGWDKFNQHLQSAELFDVAKFPEATFKSSKVVFKGKDLSEVIGDLTIKGITKPVTLKVTNFACKPHPMKKVDTCGANATATIKRSDFGLGLYAPAVSDETTLSITIEASKS